MLKKEIASSFLQIFQEGDTVVAHSQVLRQANELPPVAVV